MNFLIWLFGSEDERAFSEAHDTAVMRAVRSKLEPSFLESEAETRRKMGKAHEMRKTARALENRSERRSYLRWITFYEERCSRRLRLEDHWRKAKAAETEISVI